MKTRQMRHLGVLAFALFGFSACQKAEVLAPQPSALDLDDVAPTCPGLATMTVSTGPALAFTWGEAADDLTTASAITYSLYVRTSSGTHELVSPSKIIVGATSTLFSAGVQTGQTYHAFITCKDEAGNVYPTGPLNELSVTVTDSTPPSQITNLAASSVTFTSVFLSWSPADDGAGGTTSSQMQYKIFYGNAAGVTTSSPILTTLTGATSYSVTGLLPDTDYYFRIVAYDLVGNASTISNEVLVATPEDTAPPVFSSNSQIATGNIETSSIVLNWTNTALTDNVTPTAQLVYLVYRCSGSTTCSPFSGTLVTTTAANASTFTDTGLSASTTYVYGVRARDSSGNISTNTDKLVTSTDYSATGYTYAYPTLWDVNQRNGQGVAVANIIGDATGPNAWPDLISGAPNASEAGSIYRLTGCIFIYPGTGPGSFASAPGKVICQPSEGATGANDRNFGYAVAVGNFDGDTNGTKDLLVSAPNVNKLFFFATIRSAGTGGAPATLDVDPTPMGTVTDGAGGTQLGMGVCVGDLDGGTGGEDFAVSRPAANCTDACGTTGNGVLDVYLNSSTAGSFITPGGPSVTIGTIKTNMTSAGWVIANSEQVVRSCAIGKFDSSNPSQTQIAVASGNISPVGTTPVTGGIAFYRRTGSTTYVFQNAIQAPGPANNAGGWGDAIFAGQIDGTGSHELVVGAPTDPNVGTSAGGVYAYTVTTSGGNFQLTDTGESYYGGTDLDRNGVGSSVFMADLFNRGDGKQDLIVGASLDDGTMTIGADTVNLGKVFVYKNNSGSISSSSIQSDFEFTSHRTLTAAQYGNGTCKGDVNNDTLEDLIIGSPAQAFDPVSMTNIASMGAVYIYHGRSSGEMDFANPSQIITAPGSAASAFGTSCTVMDFNGDGQKDLLVGAPNRTVAGNANRGAVYVYYGATSANLPSAASATISGPVAQASAFFGYSLTVGDLDDNGEDDLIVGAIGINHPSPVVNNVGAVFVLWGADSTGVISTTNMTTLRPPNGVYHATNQPLANTQTIVTGMNFGYSVAVYPTVSGSSELDLVVCAPVATVGGGAGAAAHLGSGIPGANTAAIGQCLIYEGRRNAGLGASYLMATIPRNEIRFPYAITHQADIVNPTHFGSSMTVGDWDDDGVDDLVICAQRLRNNTTLATNVGGCYNFRGKADGTGGFNSPNGYNMNAGGTRAVPNASKVYLNPNPDAPAAPSQFGRSVLMMDLNNNGSLDLVVGESLTDSPAPLLKSNLGTDSGRVFIMRGGYND